MNALKRVAEHKLTTATCILSGFAAALVCLDICFLFAVAFVGKPAMLFQVPLHLTAGVSIRFCQAALAVGLIAFIAEKPKLYAALSFATALVLLLISSVFHDGFA